MWTKFAAGVAVFTLLSQSCVILSLRLTRLEVPHAIHVGESIWLNCSYDLEEDQLYSIKWYKNNDEFYRFLPNDEPAAQVYESEGIYLDVARSNYGNIYLIKTDLNTEATFRCEVSADSPSFQTVKKEKELKMFSLPVAGEELSISGARAYYQLSDLVNLTCRAGPSKPQASLNWFINGREAPLDFVERDDNHLPLSPRNAAPNASLALRFYADPHYFVDEVMTLTCTSLIRLEYSLNSAILLTNESTPGRPTSAIRAVQEGDGTIITGSQSSYNIGDNINLTCASNKSKPKAPLLAWFINTDQASSDMLKHYPKVITEDGSEMSTLGLHLVLNRAFIDIWATRGANRKTRFQISLKCVATFAKSLMESREEATIRRHEPQSTRLHIASENEVGAVHMNGGLPSRSKPKFTIISLLSTLALYFLSGSSTTWP